MKGLERLRLQAPFSKVTKLILGLTLVILSVTPVSAQGRYRCPNNAAYLHPCTCEGGSTEGIVMRCENTNLASIALGLANVRLPIQELTLYRCNMRKLFGDVFNSVQIKVSILKLFSSIIDLFSKVFFTIKYVAYFY